MQAIELAKSNTTKMASDIPHGIHEDKMPYSFLNFPSEIRNRIYRELLVYDGVTLEAKSHTHNYGVDPDFREADPYWSGCYRMRQCPKSRGLFPVDPDQANEVELESSQKTSSASSAHASRYTRKPEQSSGQRIHSYSKMHIQCLTGSAG